MRTIVIELVISFTAGLLSWIAAPSVGVQIHWTPGEDAPWYASPLGYASGAIILVFVLARLTAFVTTGSERTRQSVRIAIAAGIALVGFAALQHVAGLHILLAAAGGLLAAAITYSATSKLS